MVFHEKLGVSPIVTTFQIFRSFQLNHDYGRKRIQKTFLRRKGYRYLPLNATTPRKEGLIKGMIQVSWWFS